MAEAPYHNELPTDALCIDTDKIADLHDSDESSGWVRSPPLTRTVSKTYLDSMNTERLPSSNGQRPAPKIPRKAVGTALKAEHQALPSPLPSPTFSDYQNDFLTSWNGSEASLVEPNSPMDYEQEQPHAEKWDSWFTTSNDRHMDSSLTLVKPESHTEESTLSTWNRNYGSTNLSDLDISKPKNCLQHSPTRTSPTRPKKMQSSYTAFPSANTEPKTKHFHDLPRRPHKSWPEGSSQERPILRARANTSPLNFRSHRPTHRPSNLSICTTLDYHSPRSTSTSSTTPLYMGSPPQQSQSPTPTPGLMEYMSQQSYFFNSDDSDDEEQTWIETQKQKWHRRVFSKDHAPGMDEPPRLVSRPQQQKKKKISLGKTAALKDVFVFGRKRKEGKKDVRLCPKCWKEVERVDGNGLLVTCSCHADLCFGCLRDWDFCDGLCEAVR